MKHLTKDPRIAQIVILLALIVVGRQLFDLQLTAAHVCVCCAVTMLTQLFWVKVFRVPQFDVRSPLISGLSLSLLLRSGALFAPVLAGAIAISSKFLIRSKGKHLFNPTNFGIAMVLLCTDMAWLSHGLWGTGLVVAGFLVCSGLFVLRRTALSDVTWAFLCFYATILIARALFLGDPLSIPLHQLESGALLIFSFFMISDPKTIPNARAGRIAFAFCVAALAAYLRFGWYEPNALIYSLVACCALNPLFDRLFPAEQYDWNARKYPRFKRRSATQMFSVLTGELNMKKITIAVGLLTFCLVALARESFAFCGFYVAKADTKLFNKASKVVMVRDEDRTVLTMANDFKGNPKEFAVVIPVPTFIEREQIHVASQGIIEHLDAYSAPRLVEYHDPNPCQARMMEKSMSMSAMADGAAPAGAGFASANELGVTIEAEYTVGEYDILILSAKESSGLETWLKGNGYKIPEGATKVLGSYIKQDMRFFVAKVNLKEQSKLGFSFLRPLQVAYESHKFMLPIRLGTVNADGDQELFVFMLTKKGRVETTNYRTVKLPEGMDIPVYVKDEFSDFYKDMFSKQVDKESGKAVFLEYAWDMGWCDPCAANPLSTGELKELGVWWVNNGVGRPQPFQRGLVAPQAQNVFVTRMHVRYNGDRFPEDLMFQQTSDRTNFQARYVLRHPWTGSESCQAAESYRATLPARFEKEAEQLQTLTGWSLEDIHGKMNISGYRYSGNKKNGGGGSKWWKDIWN